MRRSRAGSRFHARLSSARWERVRRLALEAAGWRCESCGAVASEVHHKRPLHKGGAAWAAANLAALCRHCHIRAHRRPLSPAEREWIELVSAMHSG